MTTTKAIQFESPGTLRTIDVEPPGSPGPGEALVRVRRVGVCGTDISGYLGKMPFFRYPRIPGHELSVEVVDQGDGLCQPGEFSEVFVSVQNLGDAPLLNPVATLRSPPDDFNPLRLIWHNSVSEFPDFAPFTGEGASVIEQIKSAEALPPTAVRSGTPMELERVVLRCVQKDRSLRYQHADDLIAELKLVEMASDRRTAPLSLSMSRNDVAEVFSSTSIARRTVPSKPVS